MKIAQGWGEGPFRPSCAGFAFEDNKQPSKLKIWMMKRQLRREEKKAWENTVVLKGEHEDVFGLYLCLSEGNIAPDSFWEKREDLLMARELFDLPADMAEKTREALQNRLKNIRIRLAKICERAKNGEALRIWTGTSSEDRCMLAWLAAQLEEHGLLSAKVYLNQLPEKFNRPEGGAVLWNDWSEVEPANWGRLDRELRIEVSTDFLSGQAQLWHRLQQENAGLRIAENGTVKSVSEDYYDAMIQAEIDRQPEEFHEAKVIGNLIGAQLRMPDVWIACRIERLIESGQLLVTWEEEPGTRSYRRKLKKAY